MKSFLAALTIVLIGCANLAAQTNPQSYKYRVRLSVNVSKEGAFKDRLSSSMNRELRNLGDVEIVESEAIYGISVVGDELSTKRGPSPGFALAVDFVVPYDISGLREYLGKAQTSASQQKDYEASTKWLDMMGRLVNMPDKGDLSANLLLLTGASDDVESTCRDVVATFDTQILEPARKSSQQMRDMWNNAIKNAQPKPPKPESKPPLQQ